jgi:hypothetical protein
MEYNRTVSQLFVDFKKANESVRKEMLYNIIIEFGIPMKLFRLIQMCFSETCSKVRIGGYLSDIFPVSSGLKQGDAFLPLLSNIAVEYVIRKTQEN